MSTDHIIHYGRYQRARAGLKAVLVLHLVFVGLTLFGGWANLWTNPVSRYGLLTAGIAGVLLYAYDWGNRAANWGILLVYFGLAGLEFFRYGVPATGYRSPGAGEYGRLGLFELAMGLAPYVYVGLRFVMGFLLLPLIRWGPRPRRPQR